MQPKNKFYLAIFILTRIFHSYIHFPLCYSTILFSNMGPTRILTKDGGFGTQMTVHVGNAVDGDPLWSARFNATNPAAVINTHLDFLQSKH